MSRDIQMPLALDEIEVPDGRRALNAQTVKRLAESIEKIGLRHPVTVRRKGEQYVLVAGLHRIEAYRRLGHEHIPAIISSFTNADARLWEIAENLHRGELSKLERDEHLEEWRKLTLEKVRQVADPSGGQQPNDKGYRKTAEEFGVDERDVRRAEQVASLSDEAKDAAREHGLDDNRSALLEAAKEQTPAAQVAKVIQFKDRGKVTTWRDDFDRLWRRGTEDDHKWAREQIEKPIMDQRFS